MEPEKKPVQEMIFMFRLKNGQKGVVKKGE